MVLPLRIWAGLRVGWWRNGFEPVGIYRGPDIGYHLPGARLQQKLDEGLLIFKPGILFRHDLGENQKLETILILETYFPEMFQYDSWLIAEQ